MMILIKHDDESFLTLALKHQGKAYTVEDIFDHKEANLIKDLINSSGYSVLVTERNPKLYTIGKFNNEEFLSEIDFSDFNEAIEWFKNGS